MPHAERPSFDLLDPAFYQDGDGMHAAFSWMRANEPVYRDHGNALVAVTRHGDLQDVERRSSVFASDHAYRAVPAADEINMIAQDDPRHRQQRMLVQGELTGAAIGRRRPEIETLTTELIDALAKQDSVEVVEALSGQLPARLTCRLLGYPESMWPQVKSWSERLMRTDMRDRDEQVMRDFIEANTEFVQALMPLARERVGCPAHDLIGAWVNATIDGEPLPPAAIVHEVGLFISGGAETTPHGDQSRPACVRRPPGTVGGDGRRPVTRGGSRGGGVALGDAVEQHVPAGGERRPDRW